jgi:hypothetical protein
VTVDYTQHPQSLSSVQFNAFNWFVFLLVMGPVLISSSVLYSGSEICGAVARRTRSRTADASDGANASISLAE